VLFEEQHSSIQRVVHWVTVALQDHIEKPRNIYRKRGIASTLGVGRLVGSMEQPSQHYQVGWTVQLQMAHQLRAGDKHQSEIVGSLGTTHLSFLTFHPIHSSSR
jgi:hypothetical protein